MNKTFALALAVVALVALADPRRRVVGRDHRDGSICELVDLPDGGTDHVHNGRILGHMPKCTPAPAEGCPGRHEDGGTFRYVNSSRVCCPDIGKRGRTH